MRAAFGKRLASDINEISDAGPAETANIGGNLKRTCAVLFLYSAFLMCGPRIAARQNGNAIPGGAPAGQSSTLPAEGEASVSGVVLDSKGAIVADAKVTLATLDGSRRLTLASGVNGEFAFTNIASGSYIVIVEAAGFDPLQSAEFVLGAQESHQVPGIILSLAPVVTQVTVRPIQEIAAEQIRAEEKQRLLGFIPNFYTSYIHDAAPLTAKQKFSLSMHDMFDPVPLMGTALTAGAEQVNNSFPGYGRGVSGYSKRFGARLADGRTSDFFAYAVFPSLLRQDPRYYYQGTGSFKSRLFHAISFAFVTRSDSGRPAPNYSYFLGDLTSAGLSNLYYPRANRGVSLVFTNAAVGLAGHMGVSIFHEFFSKGITTNVPQNGSP